jgi:copper oxidase (laccase) domain-containing protein
VPPRPWTWLRQVHGTDVVTVKGAVGVAHAGWRGLAGGVIERAVDAMRSAGATAITARIGPCIGPAAYEFGAADLDAVAARYGDAVRAVDSSGSVALDLAAGVRAALQGAGVEVIGPFPPPCTATDAATYFSHRARREAGRQGSFVWLEA